jgi:predicted TIM-barrel fold metal-dependent hydrolase
MNVTGVNGVSEHSIKSIDTVVNLNTKERLALRGEGFNTAQQTFRKQSVYQTGTTPTELVERMDEANIDRAFLIASKEGSKFDGATWNQSYEETADVVKQFPDRFYALAGIDPLEGMDGVRQLEYAITELGFIGAHLYPHWFNLEPHHPKFYPFYAKCIELDIPIQMQVGRCLVYRTDRPPLRSVGQPIFLDTIACDFPELKLIGIHIGWPWVEEMIAIASKHSNVYIGSDAYAPKYWNPEFVHFINTWGQNKVIFGTDFPVIDFRRAMDEIEGLSLNPESKLKFLRDNAIRVYNLPL